MFQNYFKIAVRNLLKNKGYTTINILGLSLGITCCLILFLVVRFELSFDNFHENGERIYRVVTDFTRSEGMSYNQGAPIPMYEALKNDVENLEEVVMLKFDREGSIVLVEDESKKFKEERIGYVNQEYFNVFQYEWLAGNNSKALLRPNQLVISEKIAQKYYQQPENAIGKIIRLNNKYDLQITGVVKNFPDNSDFRFNLLVSLPTIEGALDADDEWGSVSSSLQHFVLLPEFVRAADFQKSLDVLKKKYLDSEDVVNTAYTLQPLSTIHFDTRYGNFEDRVAGLETIWALIAIGIFMIVTACINFINLSTAQAIKRSKEVGVRKVLGSSRIQVASQFLGETAIITFLAIIISIGLVDFLLPYINELMNLNLSFHPPRDLTVFLFLIGLFLIVSFLSGLYPSFILSRFKPIDAIKNRISSRHTGGFTLRRSLVVTQFVISQVLIIGTIIVSNQLDYFKSQDLGFSKEAILTFPLPENDNNSLATLRGLLNKNENINDFAFANTTPSSDNRWVTNVDMVGSEVEEVYADVKIGDENYSKTYGIQLLAGRLYKESDSIREVVVNETLVRRFGISDPADAIGIEIEFWPDYPVPIVGVVKDFHAVSLRDEISPLIISTDRENYYEAGVKVAADYFPKTLSEIEAAWSEVYPDYVFDYEFLDERIGAFYRREAVLSKLFQIFAGIAIFIGCLGLYGLVSFMVAQNKKEIGIRKVLGASVINILMSFSKEFTKLVIIAFLIAAPISYYLMNNWLQDFTYKIEIGIGFFLLAIISSLIVAWLTVGYKAIMAAIANPIEALKSE